MASAAKTTQILARQLLAASLVDGVVDADRVGGVLEYVSKHVTAHAPAVLKAYRRLVAREIARSEAVIDHAGPIAAGLPSSIASSMSRRYGRAITALARPDPELLAGLRVRVGDDVYELSAASQLAALARAV